MKDWLTVHLTVVRNRVLACDWKPKPDDLEMVNGDVAGAWLTDPEWDAITSASDPHEIEDYAFAAGCISGAAAALDMTILELLENYDLLPKQEDEK